MKQVPMFGLAFKTSLYISLHHAFIYPSCGPYKKLPHSHNNQLLYNVGGGKESLTNLAFSSIRCLQDQIWCDFVVYWNLSLIKEINSSRISLSVMLWYIRPLPRTTNKPTTWFSWRSRHLHILNNVFNKNYIKLDKYVPRQPQSNYNSISKWSFHI